MTTIGSGNMNLDTIKSAINTIAQAQSASALDAVSAASISCSGTSMGSAQSARLQKIEEYKQAVVKELKWHVKSTIISLSLKAAKIGTEVHSNDQNGVCTLKAIYQGKDADGRPLYSNVDIQMDYTKTDAYKALKKAHII